MYDKQFYSDIVYMRDFILDNKLTVAAILFLAAFTTLHTIKPTLIYESDGSFREFGVGFKHKTVLPIWVFAIVMGIFSYLAVLYYLITTA